MENNTAYVVCGPICSGNRLLASILVRCGCAGEGSANQPGTVEDIPDAKGPYVCIFHQDLDSWVAALKGKGYGQVVCIVMVREPVANLRSMRRNQQEFLFHRTATIARNIQDIRSTDAHLEILTYEGLCEEALRLWLPTIGLTYKPGPLELPGQKISGAIQIQNKKHYNETPIEEF